jgi:uncharacterized membrane protein
MLTVVSSSAVLLWTLRAPEPWKWGVYAVTIAVGFYTHPLFGFVVLSHSAYVVGLSLLPGVEPRTPAARLLREYVVAAACGTVIFAPWVWVLLARLPKAAMQLAWSEANVGVVRLAGMWAYNYSAVFFDTNHVLKYMDAPGPAVMGLFVLRGVVLIPAALAVLHLLRRPIGQPNLFVLLLILLPFLGLAVPDVLLGGIRSGGGNRYLAPSFLGLEIALARWCAIGSERTGGWHRAVACGTLAMVLAMGVVSGLVFRRADTWWTKSIGHFNMDVARIINRDRRPLLMSDSATTMLSLSHALGAHVRMQLVGDHDTLRVPHQYSDVYVVSPSVALARELETARGLTVDAVFPRGELYRIAARSREAR